MKLIKHLINIMFLWSIPFIIGLFFMLVTMMSFTYHDLISSEPFIVIVFLYDILIVIFYAICEMEKDPDESNGLRIWK